MLRLLSPFNSRIGKICTGIANRREEKNKQTSTNNTLWFASFIFLLAFFRRILSQLNNKAAIHMTKIWSHELFYVEKYHVLVSRIRMSVNQAAPIQLLAIFERNYLRKFIARLSGNCKIYTNVMQKNV